MKQPIRKEIKKILPKEKKKRVIVRERKVHEPGTSKLEEYFMKNFLDKLGVKYIYQFEAKDIGRFYDYFLPDENLIIELNGGYWHCDPEIYKDGPINRMQARNIRIDEYKRNWAYAHGTPVLYIWENDVRKHPEKVMKILKESISQANRKILIENNKKTRKINKL
jgi:very-short-patch-repair endonuclease